jgi:flagellar hook-associated protein 3 FlgL
MATNSLTISRVSFNQKSNVLLDGIRRGSFDLLSLQAQLASGLRLNKPSENPGLASQVLNLEGASSRQDQILKNLQFATSYLDTTDATIGELNQLVTDARSIALQNVSSITSAEEREAAAELIADIVDQFITVGNREFNGNFLFAGRDTQNAPFSFELGGVAFHGDTGDLLAHVAELDEEPINLTGADLFGALTGAVTAAVDLNPRLTESTRLEEIRTAAGQRLELGRLVFGAAGETPISVDLTGADTIGDIINLINENAGSLVNAVLGDEGITLTPVGGSISISDLAGGRLANALGIAIGDDLSGPLGGAGLRRLLTRTTRIEDFLGGDGLDLAGELLITNGPKTVSLDLSGAETVQDILNAINNAGVSVRAEINASGTGIDVYNLVSGTSLTISERDGTPATALGIRSFDTTRPLSLLNGGDGITIVDGVEDFRITAKNGDTLDVNLDGAETIGDVIDLINEAADAAGVSIEATLADTTHGLRLVDSTGGSDPLSVSRLNLSAALDDLGLIGVVEDPEGELIGANVAPARAEGILTALVDLERGLRDDDDQAISRATERLEQFEKTINRAQGVVGSRARAMRQREIQTESAVLATQQFLSELRDLDYAEAVTLFQQAQAALQASLVSGGQTANLSLLDFLG